MPRVYIPPPLRTLTDGIDIVEVDGSTVRQVIDALDAKHPGTKARLCQGDELQPGLTVAVGSNVTAIGLWQKVQPDDEVHFLPAVGGG